MRVLGVLLFSLVLAVAALPGKPPKCRSACWWSHSTVAGAW
jgi:hypothetical protein